MYLVVFLLFIFQDQLSRRYNQFQQEWGQHFRRASGVSGCPPDLRVCYVFCFLQCIAR